MISYTADNVIRLKVLSDNQSEINKAVSDFYENAERLFGNTAYTGVDFESNCVMLSMKKNEEGYYYSPFPIYLAMQKRYENVIFYGIDCYKMWDQYKGIQLIISKQFADVVGGPAEIDINSIDEVWDINRDMHLFGKREIKDAEKED